MDIKPEAEKVTGTRGQKAARETLANASVTMANFVGERFKGFASRAHALYDASRNRSKAPFAGPLADGYFKVTPSGVITLETLSGSSEERRIVAPLDYVNRNWEAVEAALNPSIGGAVKSSASAADYNAADDALSELFGE